MHTHLVQLKSKIKDKHIFGVQVFSDEIDFSDGNVFLEEKTVDGMKCKP